MYQDPYNSKNIVTDSKALTIDSSINRRIYFRNAIHTS